jgi:hypothetical protein
VPGAAPPYSQHACLPQDLAAEPEPQARDRESVPCAARAVHLARPAHDRGWSAARVHTLVRTHAQTYTHAHTHTHAPSCTHVHTCTHSCAHTRADTRTHAHLCAHARAHARTPTHIRVRTHAHSCAHACAHTRTRALTRARTRALLVHVRARSDASAATGTRPTGASPPAVAQCHPLPPPDRAHSVWISPGMRRRSSCASRRSSSQRGRRRRCARSTRSGPSRQHAACSVHAPPPRGLSHALAVSGIAARLRCPALGVGGSPGLTGMPS